MTDALTQAIRRTERDLREMRRQQRKARPRKLPKTGAMREDPNADAEGYMRWLHEEHIGCIACVVEGPAPMGGEPNPIEVAHQRRNDPRWRGNGLGKRSPDAQSCPLCRWHHQRAPNACDRAQGKFWDRLGVDVVAYCAALFAAFKAQEPGAPVLEQFAATSRKATP